MQADSELNRLAARAGIEPRYWDIQGRLYETTPEIARAVLYAFGLPATTDAEVSETLNRLDEKARREFLPPVVTARENEEIAVPVRLPLDSAGRFRWSVRLESGDIVEGECEADALPARETGADNGSIVASRILTLAPLPTGYHELRVETGGEAACALIVAPSRCYLPQSFAGKRLWGVAAQLYALNGSRNWGMGDFGDLAALIDFSADHGADAVGLNPLHALFLDAPAQASPYSPSSRLFRNPLYLDIAVTPDFQECEAARALVASAGMQRAIEAARAGRLVDYEAIAKIKISVLERLYENFRDRHLSQQTARSDAFSDFMRRSGDEIRRFAAWQALSEQFGTHDWRRWPAGFEDCRSQRVEDFQRNHADRISFFAWLQWLCESQVSQAAGKARERRMTIGLYNDFAVGVDAAGFDHWAHQSVYAGGLRAGVPPDPFNERGQEWGVVPFNPRRLKKDAYMHFKKALNANMRHAGAIRIDHIIGWRRLFVVPDGAPPASGVYVNFPLDDLLAIAALESHRNRCVVIGEDLGTVPEGFRDRMAVENVLSCRILYFERDHERFRKPKDYPFLATAAASTHDLATLRGFWCGDDITAKARLGIFASEEMEAAARAERADDKRRLQQALHNCGLAPGTPPSLNADEIDWTPELARAVHVYLARTPSLLLMIQLDDLANELRQANLPGSTTEHPNWRRRISRTLADLHSDTLVLRQMTAINETRRA